jgi:3-isopropylmalate/(R)-2-methylmalate dehydratase small subunit
MHSGWRTRGHAHVYGHDLPHDGGIVPMKVIPMRLTDPDAVVPFLFEEQDPPFRERVRPGDFIIAGRNFGCGKPHTAGYLGMKALGLRILCESMPYTVSRSLMNIGVPFMTGCEGIAAFVRTGDEVEADFESGEVRNLTTGETRRYPALDPRIRGMIEAGGMQGMLRAWLASHPELGTPR